MIKFRIWDKQAKRFVANDSSLHCYSNWAIDPFTGKVIDYVGIIDGDHESGYSKNLDPGWYMNGINPIKEPQYIAQQFVGLLGRKKQEIYVGDVVEFKYSVGDFAWEFMDEDETESQNKMLGKKFVGVIEHSLDGSINVDIRVGSRKGTHTLFPILYAQNAKVIGNILENPEKD